MGCRELSCSTKQRLKSDLVLGRWRLEEKTKVTSRSGDSIFKSGCPVREERQSK